MVSAMGSAAKMPATPNPSRGISRISGISRNTLRSRAKKVAFLASPRATKVFWLAVCRANRKVSRKKMRSMGTAVASRSGSLLNTEMIWGMHSWISPQATTA